MAAPSPLNADLLAQMRDAALATAQSQLKLAAACNGARVPGSPSHRAAPDKPSEVVACRDGPARGRTAALLAATSARGGRAVRRRRELGLVAEGAHPDAGAAALGEDAPKLTKDGRKARGKREKDPNRPAYAETASETCVEIKCRAPTPSTRCRLRSCVCSMACRFTKVFCNILRITELTG